MKNSVTARLLLCACSLAAMPAAAQVATVSPARGGDQLKMVVILSRHGVRSPTWPQERLSSYSVAPWPEFKVAPGLLTARGYTLIRQFAAYDRQALAAKGLFSAKGCDAATTTYLWADTDQRTMETGRAFAEGLFPGCALPVHSLAAGESDPLFHPTAGGVAPDDAAIALGQLSRRVSGGSLRTTRQLDELQNILLGCAPKAECAPSRLPQTMVLGTSVAAVPGKGDRIVDLQGPLAAASTLAEDFLLEYADNLPMNQVAWGLADEGELRSLLELHTDYFDLMHRTPQMARLEASNMLSHITRTLEQSVEQKAVPGALGPVGTKLVVLAGHDTNLAGVAALLGVHWTLDGRIDDTPPGTELAFELWQSRAGDYSVRVTAAMQTLPQLRNLQPVTPAMPPAQEVLTLPGCGAAAAACKWEDFLAASNQAAGVQMSHAHDE